MTAGEGGGKASRGGPLSGDGWSGRTLDEVEVGADLRPAWRRGDKTIEADAIAFWARMNILPAGVDPAARARELAAVAYEGGRLVAVSTAAIARYEPLRASFAFYRCAVDPSQRRSLLATAITAFTRDVVEAWAAEHPEEGVAGLAAIIESPDLVARQRAPLWPNTRLNLAGFTPDGRQVRIAWFDHYRV